MSRISQEEIEGRKKEKDFNIKEDNLDVISLADALGLSLDYDIEPSDDDINHWLGRYGLKKIDQYFLDNADTKTITYTQLAAYLAVFYRHRYFVFNRYFNTVDDALASLRQFDNLETFINNFDNPNYFKLTDESDFIRINFTKK